MQCKARDCTNELPTSAPHNQDYCCPACSKRERAKLEREARNIYDGPLVCAMPGCGNTFEQNRSRTKRYCSPECTNDSKQFHTPRIIDVDCEYCGETFQRSQKSTRRFCSRLCRKNGQTRDKVHNRKTAKTSSVLEIAIKRHEQRQEFKARMRMLAQAREYSERTGVPVYQVAQMLSGGPRQKYGKRFASRQT